MRNASEWAQRHVEPVSDEDWEVPIERRDRLRSVVSAVTLRNEMSARAVYCSRRAARNFWLLIALLVASQLVHGWFGTTLFVLSMLSGVGTLVRWEEATFAKRAARLSIND